MRQFIALAAAAAVQTASAATQPLTVKEVLEQAMTRNVRVQIGREKVNEADANYKRAISSIFPSVDGAVAGEMRRDSLTSRAPLFGGEQYNNYSFDVRVVQPIFRGGALRGAWNAAREAQERRQIDLKIAERDLVVKVVEAFYGLLVSQRAIDTLEKSKKVQEELLKTQRERVKVGLTKKVDRLQAETQLALHEPKILEARNKLQINAVELAELLGEQHSPRVEISGALEPPDWDALFVRVKDREIRSLEVEGSEHALKEAASQRKILLSKHWPSLDAELIWGRNAFVKADLFDSDATTWSMGLKLKIPLFSGLSSVSERKAIGAQLAALDALEVQIRSAAELGRIRALKDVELQGQLLKSTDRALKLAEEAFSEALKGYRFGTETYVQLSLASRTRLDAELALDRARYDLITAISRAFAAHGWGMDELVASLR